VSRLILSTTEASASLDGAAKIPLGELPRAAVRRRPVPIRSASSAVCHWSIHRRTGRGEGMSMKRLFGMLLIAALPLTMVPSVSAQVHPSVLRQKIKIVNFAFKPATVNIAKGTKVIWKNTTTTTSHTSTSDTGVWDSGVIAPGGKFAFKFTTDGTFTYHCSIHTFMTGTINVTG
jgi:plastocyanin